MCGARSPPHVVCFTLAHSFLSQALALFTVLFLANVAIDRCVKGQRHSSTKHLNSLVSPALVMMYVLYIHITKTIIDGAVLLLLCLGGGGGCLRDVCSFACELLCPVFNCSPILPPGTCPVDLGDTSTTPVDTTEYLQVGVLEECGKPGGLQMTLLPFAVVAFVVYTFGYPFFVAMKLLRNRPLAMQDQLLRAMGTGDTRVSNPTAYNFRRRYHKLYYLFKPDCFFWILIIIARKFSIAFVALLFSKNPAFQLSMALLVMFSAYALVSRSVGGAGEGPWFVLSFTSPVRVFLCSK